MDVIEKLDITKDEKNAEIDSNYPFKVHDDKILE